MGRRKIEGPTERSRHFTDEIVRRLAKPSTGSTFYWDTKQPGLGLRVWASNRRVYVVEVRFRSDTDHVSRTRRETIGTIEDWPVERARGRAAKIRSEYKQGRDRRAERERAEVEKVTLRTALAEFLKFKAEKGRKSRTLSDIQAAFDAAFPDWIDRPLASITGDMVLDRHLKRTRDAKRTQQKRGRQGSGARADLEMRYLRAVFRWARRAYRVDNLPILPDPPTDRLGELEAWNAPGRRTRTLEPDDMPAWYGAVMALDHSPVREWLRFLFLTGLRSSESRALEWRDVDLQRGSFMIRDPKNRQDVELPVTSPVREILDSCVAWRSAERVHVFPGATDGYPISDSTGAIRVVVAAFGRPWSPHDCRAAFQTAGVRTRIHPLMLRMLMNHAIPKNDAHAVYFRPTLAEKREAAEAIQRNLLRAAAVPLPTMVSSLEDARRQRRAAKFR
jgi:integrase